MDFLKEIVDDKSLVIVCTTALAFGAMFFLGAEGKEIISNVVTGLMGIAVGKTMTQKG